MECFKAMSSTKEIARRPNYTEKNDRGRTAYDEALNLHGYMMNRMTIPKKASTPVTKK
jgi:hypothetical protein